MRENTDQKSSEYRHFPRSVIRSVLRFAERRMLDVWQDSEYVFASQSLLTNFRF